jgi:hypothetical protein
MLKQEMAAQQPGAQVIRKDGQLYSYNPATKAVTHLGADKEEKDPTADTKSIMQNWKELQLPDPSDPANAAWWRDFATKKLGGAGGVTVNNNLGAQNDYNAAMAGSVAKRHQALAEGVEDFQTQVRDLNEMRNAVQAIQAKGGTTGVGQETLLKGKSAINSLANAFGIEPPNDISDAESLRKFSSAIVGAQAKGVAGGRGPTNFDMKLFQQANPGLETSLPGNLRMLGIASQVADRNAEVGQAIRDYSAQQIGANQKVDPAAVEKIIRDYDAAHHVVDPDTGQDLTKKYALPGQQAKKTTETGQGTPPPTTQPTDIEAEMKRRGLL